MIIDVDDTTWKWQRMEFNSAKKGEAIVYISDKIVFVCPGKGFQSIKALDGSIITSFTATYA